jgi:hypothetical protein
VCSLYGATSIETFVKHACGGQCLSTYDFKMSLYFEALPKFCMTPYAGTVRLTNANTDHCLQFSTSHCWLTLFFIV